MPEDRKLRVFLCHSSNDKPAVRELFQRLKSEGWIDPWLDEEKLYPGQDWDLEIEKAVEAADAVIVFLSNNSVNKEGYVQRELRFILRLAGFKPEGTVFVIPVRLEDCILPRRLAMWQFVDYFPKKRVDWAYQRLLDSLKARVADQDSLEVRSVVEQIRFEGEDEKDRAEKEENYRKPLHTVSDNQVSGSIRKLNNASNNNLEPRKNIWLPYGIGGLFIIVFVFLIFGLNYYIQQLPVMNKPGNEYPNAVFTATSQSIEATFTQIPILKMPSPTELPVATSFPDNVGSLRSEKDGMVIVYIPAGEFQMGSEVGEKNEHPVHNVYLDAYWIDQTEVTNGMYARCVMSGHCNPPRSNESNTHEEYFGNSEFDNFPVIYVSWNDAKVYCEWVTRRLPTEAEWEKAALGTYKWTYPWGNEINCELTNYNADQGICSGDTRPVGSYEKGRSPYGVYDMAGNVYEWVNSLYKPYPFSASDGRENLTESGSRVLRGGSFLNIDYGIRSASRDEIDPTATNVSFGFRCALSASE